MLLVGKILSGALTVIGAASLLIAASSGFAWSLVGETLIHDGFALAILGIIIGSAGALGYGFILDEESKR